MKEFLIVTFNNTHEAMKAESVCINEKLKVTMMPTPTYITKSCGISLKADIGIVDSLKEIIKDKKMEFKTIYQFIDSKLIELNID
ncbi:DUF3343 domain-containing protein [Clostridium sp. UBA5119]|uniref:DUF3343 domain-containing protein n=1 Tax=Clostridium sp. UBA5119 TaxID=1946366 RepID=UPI0032169CAE